MVDRIRAAALDSAMLASQGEAVEGVNDSKLMTPLRVAEAIAALGGGGSGGGGGGLSFQFFTSGRTSGELTTSLPLGAVRRRIYSVGPIPLEPNDLLIAWGEFEYTSDDPVYNTMVMSNIALVTSATATAGIEITDTNGRNVTPNMHHDTHVKIGGIMPGISGTRYVNLIAYADSSSATVAPVVEQDYGHLDVLILRPS